MLPPGNLLIGNLLTGNKAVNSAAGAIGWS